MTVQELGWAIKRLVFFAYIGFSLVTVVGGFLTAPVMTYYFFGDWRFWRHWSPGWRLYFHGWRMAALSLRGDYSYMFSVSLTDPPAKVPDRTLVRLRTDWTEGSSCGSCRNCCELIHCPILDGESGLCLGYDSFFWRYLNCGRFPTAFNEIEFYGCPKWESLPGQQSGVDQPDRLVAYAAQRR